MNITVSKSDLEKIGADSIKVPGKEDQYIAELGVYHELHFLVSTSSKVKEINMVLIKNKN
jgi:hypothetical protein